MKRRLATSAFALLLIAAVVPVGSAPAAPASAETRSRQGVESVARRLRTLLAADRYDEARALARRTLGHAPDAPLHLGHLEGLILERQDRFRDAATVFRRVLSLDPNFTPSRIELARVLYRLGETGAAIHHLEAVHRGARESGLSRLVEDYISEIDRERDRGFSGYVSLAPSTNINNGTTADDFVSDFGVGRIDDSSKRKSGLGIAAGGTAYKKWALNDRSALTVSGSADIRKYSNGTDFDQLALTTGLTYRHSFDRFTFKAGPIAEYRLLAWEPYWTRFGGSAGVDVPIARRNLLSTNVTMLAQDYVDYDYRDGWLGNATVTLRHLFSPSLQISLAANIAAERTRRDHLDHNDFGGRAEMDREWRGGLLTSAYAGYETHDYLGNFPFTSSPRRDDRWTVGGRLAHRSISFAGFAPQAYYQYTRQNSNIPFYDYDSHNFGVTLTRRF